MNQTHKKILTLGATINHGPTSLERTAAEAIGGGGGEGGLELLFQAKFSPQILQLFKTKHRTQTDHTTRVNKNMQIR